VGELGRTLGEELLEPTRIYALDVLDLIGKAEIHAMSHITGGGLVNNMARVIPDGMRAVLQRSSWTPGPIFQLVQSVGSLSQADVDATLNMGVGMVAILPQDQVTTAQAALRLRGVESWVLGEIVEHDGPGAAELV